MAEKSFGHGRMLSGNSRRGGHTDFHAFGPRVAARFSSPPSPARPILPSPTRPILPAPSRSILTRQLTQPKARFAEVKEPTFAVITSPGFVENNRFEIL